MLKVSVRRRTYVPNAAGRVEPAVRAMLDRTSEQVRADMYELTSGTTSSAQLRKEGHPFARVGGTGRRFKKARGARSPLPINVQHPNDGLRASLYREAIGVGSNLFGYRLGFQSPHQLVLLPGGLKYMTDRGFWKEARQRARAHIQENVAVMARMMFR